MTNTKKVVKRTKKVNEKDIAKEEIMAIIHKALEDNNIKFKDGVDYGMTKGTIIVEHEKADVQIKPITPKVGLTRYQEVVYVEEWLMKGRNPLQNSKKEWLNENRK